MHEHLSLVPYKPQKFQMLKESDEQKLLNFKNYYFTYLYCYSEHLYKISFSDECMLQINGLFNKQIVRIWGGNRPE